MLILILAWYYVAIYPAGSGRSPPSTYRSADTAIYIYVHMCIYIYICLYVYIYIYNMYHVLTIIIICLILHHRPKHEAWPRRGGRRLGECML